MKTKAKRKLKALVIVAHPDDEVIFFGGLLLNTKKYDWHVLCVTDGNAAGQGESRQEQFEKSCKMLGVSNSWCWKYPDVFEKHLDVPHLVHQLQEVSGYSVIFTHGILGEYGHRHHQDVSFATHSAFSAKKVPVYSTAYNIYPDIKIDLSAKEYRLKNKIFWEVYSGETKRFLNLLPSTSFEGFTRVRFSEVEAIYRWLHGKFPLRSKDLRSYAWLEEYLMEGGGLLRSQIF